MKFVDDDDDDDAVTQFAYSRGLARLSSLEWLIKYQYGLNVTWTREWLSILELTRLNVG